MHLNFRLPVLLCAFGLATGCEEPPAQTAAAQEDTVVLPGTETYKDFGDYVVHFSTLLTAQLTPQVAANYGIVRSKNRAMLSVSILHKQEGTMGSAVTGSVSASAINLTGQYKDIALREIKEGDAVYYIGETGIADGETLIFTVDATPINEPSRFTVRFKKQFFVDD